MPIHLVPPLGGLLSTRGGHGKELQPCFTIREDFTDRQLQLVESSAAVTELLGLQGLELAAASFVAGGLLVALLCGAGILACRCRSRRAARARLGASRDQKHLAETTTSMVAVDRGKAAAPLSSPSAPPRPPPAPPRLPPGWEQHETDDGDTYYHNAATGATRWDRP